MSELKTWVVFVARTAATQSVVQCQSRIVDHILKGLSLRRSVSVAGFLSQSAMKISVSLQSLTLTHLIVATSRDGTCNHPR